MPTYPSPVTVTSFQMYMRDGSSDPTVLAFYQLLLATATEKVYTYLDRDFTAGASKVDVFFGNGLHVHRMFNPCETLVFWKTIDSTGTLTVQDISELLILANGEIVVNAKQKFDPHCEHRIKYTQPAALACPESVMQVITEVAAVIFEESKLGGARLGIETESDKNDSSSDRARYIELTDRQKSMLAPYKKISI